MLNERREFSQRRARRELARRHLIDFALYVDPMFEPARHLRKVAEYLEAIRSREIKRLMIFAPPRHGKSKLTSELFPAWSLGVDTGEQFMLASHTQSLSDTFSKNVRNMINADVYTEIFPATQLSADSATIQKWTLAGYTRPAMMSIGVGGSPTGQGARVLIIDDPIGDYRDAESAAQRESLYQWYTNTIYPRLEPGAAIILMMQRWHEDDLAGRLLRDQSSADRWEVVSMPAMAESQEDRDQINAVYGKPAGLPDPLNRAAGQALWPSRYSAQALAAIQKVSPRSFDAKYSQRPRAAKGTFFKEGWLQIVDSAPVGLRWVRYYDLAYSIKQTADNTATIGASMDSDGVIYLRKGRAGKMEAPDVSKLIKELMLAEPQAANGIESAVQGGAAVQEVMRDPDLVGIGCRAIHVDTDKMVRATPVADRAETGKVKFVRESYEDDAWISEWIGEMLEFPYGAHDDRVDAVSGCFAMLTGGSGWEDYAREQLERQNELANNGEGVE